MADAAPVAPWEWRKTKLERLVGDNYLGRLEAAAGQFTARTLLDETSSKTKLADIGEAAEIVRAYHAVIARAGPVIRISAHLSARAAPQISRIRDSSF